MTTPPSSCRSLLQGMVAVDSINEHLSNRRCPEAELGEYLEEICKIFDLSAARLPVDDFGSFNLIVTCRTESDRPWLLFESHMDTVGIEGMTIAPFEAEIDGGRLYGRGSCDTKASGAAMLWALRRYSASGEAVNNIALLFTVDEESTKRGITSFVDRQLHDLQIRPAGAIVGEPTNLRPVVAHCGVARFCIRTHGVAAHSSNPANGRSAIRMMVQVIEALESGYIARLQASHPLIGPAQCSINIIRGGTAINIVPDECEIWIDRRVIPGEDPENVMVNVEKVLAPLGKENPDFSYSFADSRVDFPLDPAGGQRFISSVCDVLSPLGLPNEPVGAGFGSDGSTLARTGIPVVLLGPGDIAQAHSEAEYVELDELDSAVEAYFALMCSSLIRPSARGTHG